MSPITLFRASGMTLLLGVVLFLGGSILSFAAQPVAPLWVFATGVWISGMALQLLGLPGVVARQAAPGGWPAVVGYALTFFAWFLFTGFYLVDNLILSSWLDALAPHVYSQWSLNRAVVVTVHVANALLTSGGALLGLATLRAGVFARGAGVLLVTAAAASLGSYVYGNLTTVAVALVALGLGWMGYTLLTARGAATRPASPAAHRVSGDPVGSPRATA